jgi:hypothetical protein
MKIDRDLADALYRTDFTVFCYRAFEALNPGQRLIANWHIDAICYRVQQMVTDPARKRLVVNLPPRTLSSRWPCRPGCWGANPVPGLSARAIPTSLPLNSPVIAGRCWRHNSINAYFRRRD